MKEFHKITSTLKDNLMRNQFPQSRRSLVRENIKITDQIPKNNLPELKLTKLKIRPGSDPEQNQQKEKNKINNKTGLKYVPFIPKVHKNHSLIKKTELMFPKIKNATNNNFFEQQQENNNGNNNMIITNFNKNNFTVHNNLNKFDSKRKGIHSKRGDKIKTLYGTYGINSKNVNNINNNPIPNKNNFNDKINDIEKSNCDNTNNNNSDLYMVNLHKIKSKIPKYPKNNKSLPSKGTKIKKNKKDFNFKDSLTIKPLINYPKNNNFINLNNYMKSPIINNNINLEGKTNSIEQYPKNPSIVNNNNINKNVNLTQNIGVSTDYPNPYKIIPQTISPNPIINDPTPESKFSIENILSLLALFSGVGAGMKKEPVELSPEIFKNTYNNFTESIISSPEEFSKDDIIRGYAFNSSMGNIRDYNEDTITATKIILDGQNDKNTFFFAVYDGHGGNGCSLYLKENLHNFIKTFSKDSLNEAINLVEENYIKNEALNEKGELKDPSGSCGIIALIQQNKLIIGNVGDSRLVIFKKSSLFFCTEDHKPGSPSEKLRIEKAGGTIYQTPSLFPLHQNGKEIETPWRVLPGRLSVSRTFGDVEAKNENLGGMKNVVVALPDITEIELDDDFNFMVLGCDGIFDVLSNEEILECVKIVIKEKDIKDLNSINISELCGYIADMIIKSSLAKDSYDNVSCIVVAINMKDLLN